MPEQCLTYSIKIHSLHEYHTRTEGGLFVPYARTNLRKFAMKCRGQVVWNEIPSSIKNPTPLHVFKKF